MVVYGERFKQLFGTEEAFKEAVKAQTKPTTWKQQLQDIGQTPVITPKMDVIKQDISREKPPTSTLILPEIIQTAVTRPEFTVLKTPVSFGTKIQSFADTIRARLGLLEFPTHAPSILETQDITPEQAYQFIESVTTQAEEEVARVSAGQKGRGFPFPAGQSTQLTPSGVIITEVTPPKEEFIQRQRELHPKESWFSSIRDYVGGGIGDLGAGFEKAGQYAILLLAGGIAGYFIIKSLTK